MAAIGQFGVKAVVDIDWDAELAEGTDGALCDSTGGELRPSNPSSGSTPSKSRRCTTRWKPSS